MILYFTGWKHAGENLTEVLRQREVGRESPILMCDALSRNVPREFRTVLANCLVHGRREFVDIREGFRGEGQHVLEQLAEVYRVDAEAKERSLNPLERLHQTHSGPVMAEELAQKRTEPNSGLGKRPRLRLRQHARADKCGSYGILLEWGITRRIKLTEEPLTAAVETLRLVAETKPC